MLRLNRVRLSSSSSTKINPKNVHKEGGRLGKQPWQHGNLYNTLNRRTGDELFFFRKGAPPYYRTGPEIRTSNRDEPPISYFGQERQPKSANFFWAGCLPPDSLNIFLFSFYLKSRPAVFGLEQSRIRFSFSPLLRDSTMDAQNIYYIYP